VLHFVFTDARARMLTVGFFCDIHNGQNMQIYCTYGHFAVPIHLWRIIAGKIDCQNDKILYAICPDIVAQPVSVKYVVSRICDVQNPMGYFNIRLALYSGLKQYIL